MARHQHRRTIRSRLSLLFGAVLIMITAALAALAFFRVEAIEYGLTAALERNGLEPVTFNVEQVGLNQTVLGPISLAGGAARIEKIQADYRFLLAAFDSEPMSLEISGLQLQATWTGDRITFGRLDQFFSRLGQKSTATPPQSDITSDQGDSTPPPISVLAIKDARLIIDGFVEPIVATLDLELDVSSDIAPAQVRSTISGPGIDGQLSWNGILDMADPYSSGGSGSLKLDVKNFAPVADSAPANAEIDIELTLSAAGLELSTRSALNIEIPWPQNLLPLERISLSEPNVAVTIEPNGESSHLFSLTNGENGLRATTDIGLSWKGLAGTGRAEVMGRIDLGPDNLPQDFLFERLNFYVQGLPSPYGDIEANLSAAGLRGPIAVTAGPVEFSANITNGTFGRVEYSNITASGDADFRLDGLSLAFDLGSLAIAAEGIHDGSRVRFEDVARVSLAPGSAASQTLTTVFGADGSATVTFDLGMAIETGDVALLYSQPPLLVNGIFPSLMMEGYWVSGEQNVDLGLFGSGGEIRTDFGLLRGIQLSADGGLSDISGVIKGGLSLTTGETRNNAGSPVSANITLINEKLFVEGVAALPRGQALGNFNIAYDTAVQTGTLDATIGPLKFGGSEINPSDLRPLGLPLTPTSGEFYAQAEMTLGGLQGPQNGTVIAKDLEVDTGNFRFERINTLVELENVWPPKTSPDQQLAIGLMQAGMPLTDLVATYSMPLVDTLEISELKMSFAGGRVAASPATLSLNGSENQIEFSVEGVELAELAFLSGLAGLSAEGKMSGKIPVRLIEGDAIVENGTLTTEEPGYISYKSESATSIAAEDNGGYGLALQALEDFQYDTLTLGISGSLSDQLEASLQLNGRNPALYDGYPIEFNLNLSGELANVIRGSLAGYRVPESIKRQLMAFPQSP